MGAIISRTSESLAPTHGYTTDRVRAILEAQTLIQDAMDIASTLQIVVVSGQHNGHALFDLVVYDQHDLAINALCESSFDSFKMAFAAVRRLTELLNNGDAHTLAVLLDHVDRHYAGVAND